MQDFIEHYKDLIFGSFVGLIGAIVALPYHKAETPALIDKVWFLFTGTACAVFFTEPVMDYMNLKASYVGGVGFLLGACGGSLLAAVIRAVKGADFWAFVKARLGIRG